MRSLGVLLTTTLSLSTYAAAHVGGQSDIWRPSTHVYKRGNSDNPHVYKKRNIVYDGSIGTSYDFIIVGGGASLFLVVRFGVPRTHEVIRLPAPASPPRASICFAAPRPRARMRPVPSLAWAQPRYGY